MELFKIVKYRIPISLLELFNMSPRSSNFLMIQPKINLEISKHNFVFGGSSIWNSVIGKLLNKSSPNEAGTMIQGSAPCSDLSAPISIIKKKLKNLLLSTQKINTQFDNSRSKEWNDENFFKYTL